MIKHNRYRQVPFSIAFECKDCGALCWTSGQQAHDKFHDGLLAMTASPAPTKES